MHPAYIQGKMKIGIPQKVAIKSVPLRVHIGKVRDAHQAANQ
jgi:hypothetical protein